LPLIAHSLISGAIPPVPAASQAELLPAGESVMRIVRTLPRMLFRRDERATTRERHHQPLIAQDTNRMPDGSTGNAVLLLQGQFGRQGVTGCELATGDLL